MIIEAMNVKDERFDFTNMTHHAMERANRIAICNEIGTGRLLNAFYVDKNHPNGAEMHLITETGLVYIFNYITRKFITVLIARPQQIRRYYDACGLSVSKKLISVAYEHTLLHLNN